MDSASARTEARNADGPRTSIPYAAPAVPDARRNPALAFDCAGSLPSLWKLPYRGAVIRPRLRYRVGIRLHRAFRHALAVTLRCGRGDGYRMPLDRSRCDCGMRVRGGRYHLAPREGVALGRAGRVQRRIQNGIESRGAAVAVLGNVDACIKSACPNHECNAAATDQFAGNFFTAHYNPFA